MFGYNYLTLTTFIYLFFSVGIFAQSIKSGPMLGYNTMREVAVWVQLDQESEAQLKYWNEDTAARYSPKVKTQNSKGNTANLIAGLLEPGTTYNYSIILEGKEIQGDSPLAFTTQSLWHWRKDPPAFSFLAGSCVYINDEAYDRPGKPYGSDYPIFGKMAQEDADFMLWLGDNTYLREADWGSRSGIYHRFSHSRAVPELQPLLSNMHHYAIWDDHDYGPNDSDRFFWNKEITLEAFKDFWANPNYGVNELDGITGTFIWNDCHFFLLDNRWNRSAPQADGQILGQEQIDWMIDGLRYSKANFKFICIGGQLLSNLKIYENHANYEQERKYILDQLEKYNIQNVVILSGDRHSSEISKYTSDSGNVIYEVTSSPITSGSYDHSDEPNIHRIPGTMIGEHSYAQIHVEGTFKKRTCRVELKDKAGKVLVSQSLGAK